MADEPRNIIINSKQLISAVVALIGVIVTLSLAVWRHESNQDKKISDNYHSTEANKKEIQSLKMHWNDDVDEIKDILKETNKTQTEIRDGLIRLEEKVKK